MPEYIYSAWLRYEIHKGVEKPEFGGLLVSACNRNRGGIPIATVEMVVSGHRKRVRAHVPVSGLHVRNKGCG